MEQVPAELGDTLTVPCLSWAVPLMGVLQSAPKFAVTDWAALMVTTQDPVPEQAPLHPVKLYPLAGAAVRVTTVPAV
jgi:hypothetical protein